MRKVREVLRLKFELSLSDREVAQSVQLARSTVSDYLRRARRADLSWPLPEGLDEPGLEALLFRLPERPSPPERPERPAPSEGVVAELPTPAAPDWEVVHKELKRKGVTRLLLWREYRQGHPTGMGYTRFTQEYRRWRRMHGLSLSMRHSHKAGEKLFVDYAGLTLPITDPETGEVAQAQVFVACLGASSYTYAEATLSQGVEDWLNSHRRALEFLGGAPRVVVPDNLKAGVKSPSYYEPELNRGYAEFAEHYGLAVIPTRVRRPRDKAKVEVGVQIVERDVLAPLRDRTFFDLLEANAAVRELLEALNDRPFQKLSGSRRSLFEELERPELRPLPAEPYRVAQWRKAKVNIDYHVEVDGHYYSVPHRHAREGVELRLTSSTLEVFSRGKRVAAHERLPDLPRHRGRHTTVPDHMPKAHRQYGEWSPQRLVNWAGKNGPHTAKVVEAILESRVHPEQGYRSCLGLMRLGRTFGEQRLEAACRRADSLKAYSFRSVQSILQRRLDQEALPLEENARPDPPLAHANVRGAAYYKREATASPEGSL